MRLGNQLSVPPIRASDGRLCRLQFPLVSPLTFFLEMRAGPIVCRAKKADSLELFFCVPLSPHSLSLSYSFPRQTRTPIFSCFSLLQSQIMLPVSNMRGSKRLIVFATLLTALAVYCLSSSFSNSQHISSTTCHEARSLNQHTEQQDDASYYLNLNGLNSSVDARAKGERLLVLTTLKNASQHLERYFTLLDKTTYPNELISIGLLVTDSQDGTLEALEPLVANLQSRWSNRFSEINVFSRDYKTEIPLSSEGSPIEQEPYRRSVLARARNFLLASALRDYHSWVAWLDAEMYDYPPTIFEDLMEADVDVIVPNTLKYREDYSFWAHDRNNWAETDYSLEIQKNVGEDYLLTEGYSEMPTGRYLVSLFVVCFDYTFHCLLITSVTFSSLICQRISARSTRCHSMP